MANYPVGIKGLYKDNATAKANLLKCLGITEEEAQLLLS